MDNEEFLERQLTGARFEHVDLTGASFRMVDLVEARFRAVDLSGAVVRGAEASRLELSGDFESLLVNGVDVVPLVEAELERRHPERARLRPSDAAGYRDAWDVIEQLWSGTVARVQRLDPGLLHERVDGEWSFIETLRHLVFATDAWIRRAVLGDPSPWHALDLPWDEMPDTPGVPRDRDVRPTLAEVLDLRRDRMDTVRQLVDQLSDERLAGSTEPVEGPGWPRPRSYPVRECLDVILNEEWWHRQFAERDLDALTTAHPAAEPGPTPSAAEH
jgi:DinB superfamily/Pentapeptide repeats (8 copies)